MQLTDLTEGDFSVEILNLLADEAFLIEEKCKSVEAKNESRHVLLVIDVCRFRKENLKNYDNFLINSGTNVNFEVTNRF